MMVIIKIVKTLTGPSELRPAPELMMMMMFITMSARD